MEWFRAILADMPPTRRAGICAALILVLGAAGCGRATPQEADTEPSVPVVVEPVTLGSIRGTVSATGVVEPLPGARLDVIAPHPGRIAEVAKDVGDPVQAGELLVRFEFSGLGAESAARAATVRTADLRLRNAKLIQERIRGLLAGGAASRMEMETADREVLEADGELAEARASLNATEARRLDTTIRSPFSGTVTERLHNPGDVVRPDEEDPILRLIDPRQVQVIAAVPVAELTRFAVGATARAVAEGRPSPGLLRVLSRPEPEAGATTVAVTLAFDSPTQLAPGTQVGVEIDAEQRSNVPLVPAIAVLRDADNSAVIVVGTGSVAERRAVVTGLVDTEHVEIRSGLKVGELIVTQGQSSLRDGTPISVSSR
jgi:RND family efflux transporter MFP subunit